MLKKIHSETNRGECGMRGSILFFGSRSIAISTVAKKRLAGKIRGRQDFGGGTNINKKNTTAAAYSHSNFL
jgi:hypothetical protein